MALSSSNFEKQKTELERRAQTAEDNQASIKRSYDDVRKSLDDRSREVASLTRVLEELKGQSSSQESELFKQNSILHGRNEELLQSQTASEKRIKDTLAQLEARTVEKNILQTRHDALTLESESLQRELEESRLHVAKLHHDIEQERERCAEDERALKGEKGVQEASSSAEIARLQTLLESERSYSKSQGDSWTAATKQLQYQKEALEQEVRGLKVRAASVEDAVSIHTRELADRRKVADAGTNGYHEEREDLQRRINRLEGELADKICALDDLRPRLSKSEDQVAGNERRESATKAKLQALEDEVEVLQNALEENSDQALARITEHRQEAENDRIQLLSCKQELARMDASREAAQSEVRTLKRDLEAEKESREQLTHQLSEIKSRMLHLEGMRAETQKSDSKTVFERDIGSRDTEKHSSVPKSTSRQTDLERQQKEPKFERLDGNEPGQTILSYRRLERKIQTLERECGEHQLAQKESEKTIQELEARACGLEKDLRISQASKAGDGFDTIERRDLHETIKSAKLEAEDLQYKLTSCEARIASCSKREHSLRSQLKQLRVERDEHRHKTAALVAELDALQGRYEEKLDEVIVQQRRFEGERRAMTKQARVSDSEGFVGRDGARMKISCHQALDENERHVAETRELMKQIEFMKARFIREQNFRSALAYEKSFLLMQIDMFQAW